MSDNEKRLGRRFLAAISVVSFALLCTSRCRGADEKSPVGLAIATFDVDATPPVGFMMAYDRVRRVDELGLRCRGIAILGSGEPIVLCAVDWIGIANESQDVFRNCIAKAAGTSPLRVAVHTLHQHDAPRSDFGAEALLHQIGATELGAHNGSFAREVIDRLTREIKGSIANAKPITHAGFGTATVKDVASNRRIQDESGKVIATRYTATRDEKLRALPDGIIDPELSSVSFWNGETPVAVLSYYACHPQSYYRTGIPSPDFPGIARFIRSQDQPGPLYLHFNGASGNIGAGKYNDGSESNRLLLARRVADAMRESLKATKKFAVSPQQVTWATIPVALPLAKHLNRQSLTEELHKWDGVTYWGSPDKLAWVMRCESGREIDLSCLSVGDVRVLHMPGELFVEYQLAAKAMRPDLNIAMAAYGDYGPGYIGTAQAYKQGGYETSERATNVGPEAEAILMNGMRSLLQVDGAKSQSMPPISKQSDHSSELPRISPTEPNSAISTFKVADEFAMQLVAAEPLIGSPVAIEWDENGAMYVCEMRGYSENREDQISGIAKLTDTDQDGVYDVRTEFAEGLSWPTGLFPFDGGLFVGDAPDLFYLKDTDGDGRADFKKLVLTGFGASNVQGLMNSFRWGLDNRIHIACSSVGGEIRRAQDLFGDAIDPNENDLPLNGSGQVPLPIDPSSGVNIRGQDLALNPSTYEFEPTSGAAQHGMCFDDWGRKFVSSNSDHIQQVMYEGQYIVRNPYFVPPASRISIASDGPQAEVFRTSPVEPWRILRTRLRMSGKAKGPIEGGGRAAGYFTGATGITIYRGDAWPVEYKGLAIVGDVGSNLIHRKRLSPHGLEYIANRIDQKSEFITSSDIWFRPVQFANAPNGSLHVIDMHREVIEHPQSLPTEIKMHLDLASGRDRGRIYQIVPVGFDRRGPVSLAAQSNEELVQTLAHPNAWHRETAARLLYERQDDSVADLLQRLAQESSSPLGRMHALYSLAGLTDLKDATLLTGLNDLHEQVRKHSVRLVDQVSLTQALLKKLDEMIDDPSLDVRYQLAFTIGTLSIESRVDRLAALLRQNPNDRWMQTAVLCSIGAEAVQLAEAINQDAMLRGTVTASFINQLTEQAVVRDRIRESGKEPNLKTQASVAPPWRSEEEIKKRDRLVADYQPALTMAGNVEKGREHFIKQCSSCHRLEGIGNEIGPNLNAIKTRGAGTVLTAVLDPNREVNPQYFNYVVSTLDGRLLSGTIIDEGSISVTLRDAKNDSQSALRIEIDGIKNTGLSLMPEGFETVLNLQGMADLLSYLMQL